MHAQTGDAAVRDRITHIVAELAECQRAHGDGYIGGTTVERDGKVIDGKIVFEEVRRHIIRTGGFDINGRSEEHTSELQSLMRISYAVFCLKKKKKKKL